MLPVILSATAEETFGSLQAQIFERFGSQAAEQFQKKDILILRTTRSELGLLNQLIRFTLLQFDSSTHSH